MKLTPLNIIKTVLPLALGIYLIWYFFASMSKDSLDYFYKAIREANYFWIVLALVLSFCAYLSRAYRWKYTLEPLGFKTSFWNRYHAMMIGYLMNLLIPRAGEATRAVMLYRSDGIPFSSSFGTIIAERVIDLLMLGIVALLTMFAAHDNFIEIFDQIKNSFGGDSSEKNNFYGILIYSVLGFLVLGFILLMVFNARLRKKCVTFLVEAWNGLTSIFRSKNPFSYLGHTLFIWVLYISYFGIAFFSLEETSDFPIDGIFLAFIAGALGISFTNGGIGTFPLLIALVVVFYLDKENPNAHGIGNALGMLIWVSQTLFLILLGLISLVLLPKNYSKEHV